MLVHGFVRKREGETIFVFGCQEPNDEDDGSIPFRTRYFRYWRVFGTKPYSRIDKNEIRGFWGERGFFRECPVRAG